MEIEKNLVVSTAHITQEDDNLLEEIAQQNEPDEGLIVYGSEYWVMVYVGPASTPNLDRFSPAFRELFSFAQKHEEGFTFLKFDNSGEMLEGFPTFDW